MTTELWTTSLSMPVGTERQYATGFSYNNSGFIFGGVNSSFLNDLWMFDVQTNQWLAKSALPSDGRAGSSSFVINDTAYIIGGKTALNPSINEVWAYCMTNDTWVRKNNLPFGSRWRSSTTVINDKAYLIFGKDENDNFKDELFEYDYQSDSWNMISTFPGSGRANAALISMDGSLVIVAGIDANNNSYNDMWEFDLILQQWQQLSAIPSNGRKGGMCFNSSTTLYYTTGIDQNNNRLKETWKVFNPTTINKIIESEAVKIFPNPVKDQLFIDFLDQFQDKFNLEITNILGKTVYSVIIENNSRNQGIINVSGLSEGIYILKIGTNNTVLSRKFVKI